MRYLFADCLLDTQCYLLRRAGQSIRLRPKVFQVLTYLLMNRDRVIPKQELCEQVWSAQAVSDATIENCLKAIRHAIGDNGQAQRLIETRYGQGYRFVAAVTHVPRWRSARGIGDRSACCRRVPMLPVMTHPFPWMRYTSRSTPSPCLWMTRSLLVSGKW